MTPEQIRAINDAEARDIEYEIRSMHQPMLHCGKPCPGSCCQCGAEEGCDTRAVLGMLDDARKPQQAQLERLLPMVQRIIDWDTASVGEYRRTYPECQWANMNESQMLSEISEAFKAALRGE